MPQGLTSSRNAGPRRPPAAGDHGVRMELSTSAALKLYEQLTEAADDKTRARLIAEAFDALETRFPQIADLATRGDVREGELRL